MTKSERRRMNGRRWKFGRGQTGSEAKREIEEAKAAGLVAHYLRGQEWARGVSVLKVGLRDLHRHGHRLDRRGLARRSRSPRHERRRQTHGKTDGVDPGARRARGRPWSHGGGLWVVLRNPGHCVRGWPGEAGGGSSESESSGGSFHPEPSFKSEGGSGSSLDPIQVEDTLVVTYCSYSPASPAQEQGCEDHVATDYILDLDTPAADAARDAVLNEYGEKACAQGYC